MDIVAAVPWRPTLSVIVMFLGLLTFWRGLLGEHGLARRGVGALQRIAGWRVTLVGLTLIGLGAALFWESKLLLILSLAIGFVEIQEATQVIKAWRLGQSSERRPPTIAARK